ncbi:MAG: GyrI-like domain-containing protein [Anaerolineales bacterium]|nr:GyrI-like domain-containing protein [Anaerolineales bacterium]
MSYECQVEELVPQSALSIRTRTPVQELPQVLGQAYGAIFQYLGEIGQQPAGPPFAVYYNMDMNDLDIEIGFPVAGEPAGRENIQSSKTVGGKAATYIHKGPYSAVEPAYNMLTAWIEQMGLEPTGVAVERYLNDPDVTPPEDLLTQIIYPLMA